MNAQTTRLSSRRPSSAPAAWACGRWPPGCRRRSWPARWRRGPQDSSLRGQGQGAVPDPQHQLGRRSAERQRARAPTTSRTSRTPPTRAWPPTAVLAGRHSRSPAAQLWSTLPPWVLDRTAFFHHATLTNNHANLPKVLRLMGATAKQEMLPSIFAKYLAPCFGTVQVDPVSAGAGDILSIDGRSLPNVAPTGLRDLLTRPNTPADAAAGAARQPPRRDPRAAQGARHQGPAALPGQPGAVAAAGPLAGQRSARHAVGHPQRRAPTARWWRRWR